MIANTPGGNRDLGTGQWRKRKGERMQETGSDSGMRHKAQRRAAESSRCGRFPGVQSSAPVGAE